MGAAGHQTVLARYSYDPWGRRTKVTGAGDADFGYTGHFEHATSGLTLTWYRAYDSELGRWLSRDPLGENGGVNLYGYVLNSNLLLVDPFGLAPSCIFEAAWPELKMLSQIRVVQEKYIDTISIGPSYGLLGASSISLIGDLWWLKTEQDWGLYLKIRYWCVVKRCDGSLDTYTEYDTKKIKEWTASDQGVVIKNIRWGRSSPENK